MRRSVGKPTAAVMRRTCRFRPSVSVELEPGRRDFAADADRRHARPQPLGLARSSRASAGRGPVVRERHPAPQRRSTASVGCNAFHLHAVGLGSLRARIGDLMLQRAVRGQDDEPLAVRIQPPGGVDTPAGDRKSPSV